jgi:hypothetical protein
MNTSTDTAKTEKDSVILIDTSKPLSTTEYELLMISCERYDQTKTVAWMKPFEISVTDLRELTAADSLIERGLFTLVSKEKGSWGQRLYAATPDGVKLFHLISKLEVRY